MKRCKVCGCTPARHGDQGCTSKAIPNTSVGDCICTLTRSQVESMTWADLEVQ